MTSKTDDANAGGPPDADDDEVREATPSMIIDEGWDAEEAERQALAEKAEQAEVAPAEGEKRFKGVKPARTLMGGRLDNEGNPTLDPPADGTSAKEAASSESVATDEETSDVDEADLEAVESADEPVKATGAKPLGLPPPEDPPAAKADDEKPKPPRKPPTRPPPPPRRSRTGGSVPAPKPSSNGPPSSPPGRPRRPRPPRPPGASGPPPPPRRSRPAPPKPEPSSPEPARPPLPEPPKPEPPKPEPPKPEPPQPEPAQPEAPKPEALKPDAPKSDAKAAPPKREASRPDVARARPPSLPPSAPLSEARARSLKPESVGPPAPLPVELKARVDRLKRSDAVGAARALVELGLVQELAEQKEADAKTSYKTSLRLCPTLGPALIRLKRRVRTEGDFEAALEVLSAELTIAADDRRRADLLAEQGLLFDGLGRADDARRTFNQALSLVPDHAAALRGLEISLRRDAKDQARALAEHVDRLSEAYAPDSEEADGDRRLASWLQVERAELLDRRLQEIEQAEAALSQAVALEPAPGPARTALAHHFLRHKKYARVVASLAAEAEVEPDADRASRLLYFAARHATHRLRAPHDALPHLQRALEHSARGTGAQNSVVARRIHDELIRLLEESGDEATAAEVRHQRVQMIEDPGRVAHEHAVLSRIYDRLERPDRAVAHAEVALKQNPDDSATHEHLDLCLSKLGHHEQRVGWIMQEANSDAPIGKRVDAYIRAAEILERQIQDPTRALATLRAAWSIDEGNQIVFDALSALLSPPAIDPDDAAAQERNLRARLDLFTQAAQKTTHAVRRVGLLEKLATLYEEELAQPSRALAVAEQILELDPRRHSAIITMQRCARRAGDAERLSKALVAEADLVGERDVSLRRSLLLRASDVIREQLGDAERAAVLADTALTLDPKNPDALRVKWRAAAGAGRWGEARKSLLTLFEASPSPEESFRLWVEIAQIDEHRLKSPQAAVASYRKAHAQRPAHPMPKHEIARLLFSTSDHTGLAKWLSNLAMDESSPAEQAHHHFRASEVYELSLKDDASATRMLGQARDADTGAPPDPILFEALESIHARRDARGELARCYEEHLGNAMPLPVELSVRATLAHLLAGRDEQRDRAVAVLTSLLERAPHHVIAIRQLEALYAQMEKWPELGALLSGSAEAFTSRIARCGVLWSIVALQPHLGPGPTFGALKRLIAESPYDRSALEKMSEVAASLSREDAEPHVPAARHDLLGAVRAVRELTRDPFERASWLIEEGLLLEGYVPEEGEAAPTAPALECYLAALESWPESLVAARSAERLSNLLGHRHGAITAQLALAKLADSDRKKALHLVQAADLLSTTPSAEATQSPLALYEEALEVDPDSEAAHNALCTLLSHDPATLAERLGAALDKAKAPDQVERLGSEIARLSLDRLGNATVGIAAMRKVLAVTPNEYGSLMTMARLLSAQGVWPEARDNLRLAASAATDASAAHRANLDLARILVGPLNDPAEARSHIDAALTTHSTSREALELLYEVAKKTNDTRLTAETLGKLAENEQDPGERAGLALRLADAYKEAGDDSGMVEALCDAIVSAPKEPTTWTKLVELHRSDTPDGAEALAKALRRLLGLATERGVTPEPVWLSRLGLLEVTQLQRVDDGLARLRQAADSADGGPEAAAQLARGLEAAGRAQEAVAVLRERLTAHHDGLAKLQDVMPILDLWEGALATTGRVEERLSVEEVRACLGAVGADRAAQLRARVPAAGTPYAESLMGSELLGVLAPESRGPARDVCLAFAPMAAKAIRFDLSGLGVGGREKIGSRDGHPARNMADQLARALGTSFEMYVAGHLTGAPRVCAGDPPAIVLPADFMELPAAEQAFGLGRAIARISLGVAWLDDVPHAEMNGLVIAMLRTQNPRLGSGEIPSTVEDAAELYAERARKSVGWLQKRRIEDAIQLLSSASDALLSASALRQSEHRIAYALTGNVLAGFDFLRRTDPDIAQAGESTAGLLAHPITNGMLRFALSAESFMARHRAGLIWGS